MFFQRPRHSRFERVIPGSGGKLNHALLDIGGNAHPGQTLSPVVKDPDNIALAQSSRLSIGRMNPQGFATGDFEAATDRALIELAVQTPDRLIGSQVEGVMPGFLTPQPFGRFHPGRVRRTIVVAVGRNPL